MQAASDERFCEKETKSDERVLVLTVATEEVGYFPALQETCARFSGRLEVLRPARFAGFNARTQILHERLRQMIGNPFVIVVDAYDVLIVKDLRGFEADFAKLAAPVAVGYEIACGPVDVIRRTLIFGEGGRMRKGASDLFLNAGVYCGYKKDLCDLYKAMAKINNRDNADDQRIMSMHMSSGLRPKLAFAEGMVHTESKPLQYISPPPATTYIVHGAFLSKLNRILNDLQISHDSQAVRKWQREQLLRKLRLVAEGVWSFLCTTPT
jgi:hypothetical protein